MTGAGDRMFQMAGIALDDAAPATRRVRFDTPGVLRIGRYERETDYDVPVAEAERLVTHKGFHFTTAPAPLPAASSEDE